MNATQLQSLCDDIETAVADGPKNFAIAVTCGAFIILRYVQGEKVTPESLQCDLDMNFAQWFSDVSSGCRVDNAEIIDSEQG